MKKSGFRISLAAFAALLMAGGTATVGAQGQQTVVIQGGTLIDGLGGAPIANSVIVIEGDRITAVGAAGQVNVPNGAE
ncbi:MAG: amidohydrolase family protein, partial [Alphaproteobacteria bacterium]